ncbi:hypothetical protein COB72_08115 [bacterium]|nr:MAG: hypothetical protein COB72_08115 [bacterium]
MNTHIPICPKCGYDQRGEIATWESVCPLDGQCPECGLGFEWGEVFNPDRYELTWYIETARTKRQMVWRTIPTLWYLFVPSWYWREVNVQTRFRFWAIVRWLCLVTICLHALSSILVAMGNWTEYGQWKYGSFNLFYSSYGIRGVGWEIFNVVAAPFFEASFSSAGGFTVGFMDSHYHEPSRGVRVLGGYFGYIASWAVVLLLVIRFRKEVKLENSHVLRAFLLSLLAVLAAFETQRAFTGLNAYWDGYGDIIWVVGVPMIINILIFIWIQWFWIAAIHIGWRIRPGWPITILGMLASFVAVAVLFVSTIVFMFLSAS